MTDLHTDPTTRKMGKFPHEISPSVMGKLDGEREGPPIGEGPFPPSFPTDAKRNRHPIDELADIRAEIKTLKAREDEIRALILAGRCELVGDQNEASVREQASERIDTEALKRELGMERLRPFVKQSVVHVIRVKEREVLEDA